ncbi:MAG TPA: hypothetical protein VGE91_02170 [Solirubrobacterales bacterium]|jgi:uncharacterized repeat protein (TIGR01451 family)
MDSVRLVRGRRAIAVVVGLTAALLIASVPTAEAALRNFSLRYGENVRGNVAFASNTLMECPVTDLDTCAGGAVHNDPNANNNNRRMNRLDVDGFVDANGDGVDDTETSSRAVLSIPPGAEIRFAGLYWAGHVPADFSAADPDDANAWLNTLIDPPGAGGYQTVTGSELDTSGPVGSPPNVAHDWNSFADVTNIVRAAGPGEYTVGGVPLQPNPTFSSSVSASGGWALWVAYADPAEPWRNLSVFDGFQGPTQTFPVSGFVTPPTGSFNTSIGVSAIEGDAGLGGDAMQINGINLQDALTPASNFFNSRITRFGVDDGDRTPNFLNQLGWESKLVDADAVDANIIPNGATSANVTITSSGDGYQANAIATAIDLFAPDVSGTKGVTNVSNPGQPASAGDVLEYTMSYANAADDPNDPVDAADQFVIDDPIPDDATYVPGSLEMVSGDPGAGTRTDAAGDDSAEFDSANHRVVFRVGSGATASAGGTLAPGEQATMRFRVQVDADAPDGLLTNQATGNFRAVTLNQPLQEQASASIDVVPVDAPVVTCASDPNIFNTGYDSETGGILGNGENDANWQVAGPFYTPSGTDPPEQALPPPPGAVFGPAVVGNQAPGAWAASPYGNAQWISQAGTGNNNGDWYYGFRFALDPAVDPATFSLKMNFLADNDVAEVYVNGVAQSDQTSGLPQSSSDPYQYTGYALAHAAQTTLNHDWRTGTNTIVVQIKSFATAEGFDAQIVPSAICPVDLAITKSADPDPYTPGQPLTYTVKVTNAGPGAAHGLTVSDPLPATLAGADFTWTCAASEGSNCAPSGSGDIDDRPSGSYPGPSVLPGGDLTYTVTGTVPGSASGALSNTATLTPPTGTQDPGCTPDCSSTTNTPSVPLSDLKLSKSPDNDVVSPSDQIVYTLTATNDGPDPEPDATITDALPEGVTYVSDDGGCDSSALPQLTCDLGPIPSGASGTVHITVQAGEESANSTQHNTATVTGQNLDLNQLNNDAAADVFVRPVADLEIEKSVDPSVTDPGDSVAYTLVVRNNGPDDSPSAQIVDALPAGLTYVSDDGGCDGGSPPQVTCDLGALPHGASQTIHVNVEVADDVGGTVQTNSAQVTGPLTDPDADNNSDSADVLVRPLSDLSVTKTALASVRAGQLLTYTVGYANGGPTDSDTPTTITDTLPGGVTFVSSTGDCDIGSLPQLTCEVGPLAADGTGSFQVTVLVDAHTRGQITNSASIDGPNNDQNPDNNTDDADTQVGPQSTDLAIAKTADPTVVDPGGATTYTLTVTNQGPDASPSEQITDTLPAGMHYESDDGDCDTSQLPKITCDLDPIASGDSLAIHINATASPGAGGSAQDNTASVTGPGDDADPSDNSSTAQVLVTPLSDLSIQKSVSDDSIHAGHQLTYTLQYANGGPTTSDPTVVTDTLPAGVTYVSDDAGCDASAAPLISCDVGSLAADGSDDGAIQIVVSVDQDTTGEIQNAASIDGPNNDLDPSNNSDGAATQVTAAVSDLTLTKTAPPGPFKVGDQIPYKLTVTNHGPDDAPQTIVSDTLPAGLSYVSDDAGCDTSALPKVECDLGMVPDGASREVMITTRLDSPSGTSISNTASTESANGDPDPGGDTASAEVAVAAAVANQKTPKCFFGHTVTILGTNAPERIVGTPGRDVINGKGGNDVILGLGGNDLICGGAGNDVIIGGRGNDRVKGSTGNDKIRGNRGNDWLRGAPGNDRISGRQGNDKLMGNRGNDRLWGRQGNDFLLGGPGFDWGNGGPGFNRALGLNRAFRINR